MGLFSWVVLLLSRVRVPPVCLQRRVRVSWGSSALACGEKRGVVAGLASVPRAPSAGAGCQAAEQPFGGCLGLRFRLTN